MDVARLFAFWGLVFLLIAVPGPDWAYTLASGLRDRSVYPAVAGLLIGYLILTATVAAGLGVLVADSSVVLTIITIVGAGYLVYLGVGLLAKPNPGIEIGDENQLHEMDVARKAAKATADTDIAVAVLETRARTRVLRGIGVSALNPKGLLIFVAMLPQFTDADSAWPISVQMGLLGLIFAVTCAVFYTILGLTTRGILRARPAVSRVVSGASGVVMIIFGVFLLAERLVSLRT